MFTTTEPIINFPTVGRDEMEREIRSAANGVVNSVRNREAHPTYGYTKSGIRASLSFLHGLVGMYAFTTGQANTTTGVVTRYVTFKSERTSERVAAAESAVRTL